MSKTLDRDMTCDRIRKVCEERSVTVEYIAEELNVSRQTVYSWYSAKKLPTLDHMVELADITGTSIDELVVSKDYISGSWSKPRNK